MKRTQVVGWALAGALLAAGGLAAAQGYGYGPGMMGGYGPGYGPGMMGGNGPGMMGGYGRGMMGDGASFGATAPFAALNLSDEQRDKIAALREENRRKNWDSMGKVRAEQFKLRGMLNAENVDSAAIAEQQRKVDELRREMLVSRVETHKQMLTVLTPEQRKEARRYAPWWAGEENE